MDAFQGWLHYFCTIKKNKVSQFRELFFAPLFIIFEKLRRDANSAGWVACGFWGIKNRLENSLTFARVAFFSEKVARPTRASTPGKDMGLPCSRMALSPSWAAGPDLRSGSRIVSEHAFSKGTGLALGFSFSARVLSACPGEAPSPRHSSLSHRFTCQRSPVTNTDFSLRRVSPCWRH